MPKASLNRDEPQTRSQNLNQDQDEATKLARLAGLDNEGESAEDAQGEESPETLNRRKFLRRLSLAVGGVGAALAVVPVVGFVVLPIFKGKPEVWREIHPPAGQQPGQTAKVQFLNADPYPWGGAIEETAAWLRLETDGSYKAFSIDCTHLGCPVDWVDTASLFFCPCHGGVFYKDGSVAAGPPPKPLQTYPVRVQNGKIEIRTSPLPIS
jgi:menaquinol-cytochrome c reductase iron-sulfur subunit